VNNADFIIPVEIDGTVHQVGTCSAEVSRCIVHTTTMVTRDAATIDVSTRFVTAKCRSRARAVVALQQPNTNVLDSTRPEREDDL